MSRNASFAEFFALVAVFSLPFYLLGALGPDWTQVLPVPLPISVLTICVPFGVALWLIQQETGWSGVRKLLLRVFDVAHVQPKTWLLPAFLLLPLAAFVAYTVQRLLGQAIPDTLIPPSALAVSFVAFFAGAVLEEVGWTAYATERLQRRYSAFTAALLLGVFWQLWHVVPHLQAHHSADWIFWHSLRGVAMRVLMVWVYNNAGRSLFTAITLHASSNVADYALPDKGASYDPLMLAVVLWLLVGLVVWGYGARTLTRGSRLSARIEEGTPQGES